MTDNAKAVHNEFLSENDINRLITDIPEDSPRPGGKRKDLYTVGFTIRNLAALIGDSLGDRGVLGWFIHLPPPSEKTSQSLTLNRLVIREVDGDPVLGTDPILGEDDAPVVDFKLFVQNADPTFNTPVYTPDNNPPNSTSIFDQAQAYTDGQLFPSPSAQVRDISHYTEWSDACFFTHSDLKFMQLLLLAQADRYNDLLFSGAKVRFDIMHNPLLRVEQFTLKDKSGAIIPDSGRAFAMKAEPVMNTDKSVPTGKDMITLLGAPANGDFSQRGTTSGNEMFPGAVMDAPCPPFWQILNEIGKFLEINSVEGSKALMAISNDIDDIVQGKKAGEHIIQLSPIIRAEKRNWLFKILSRIINFFTKWRDGIKK